MKVINTPGKYDGSQITPGWAAAEFKLNKNEDSIVVMRGPMDVKCDEMVDLEDLRNGEEIRGDDLVHFIVEHHDSNNVEIAYLRQRLFTCIACEVLSENEIKISRKGDDLFYGNKKLSVSVATSGENSIKFHFGINVTSKGTPDYLETAGLNELGFDEDKIKKLSGEICEKYAHEIKKIKSDIKKTKLF
jgi:hypothetical protein